MPPDLSAKFALVSQHLNARRYEQARALLARIVQQAPSVPEAHNGMAIALTNLGRSEQALFYARRAAELAPDDANNLNTLGSCLSSCGKDDEAIAVLKRAVSLEPRGIVERVTLSNALWTVHRCTESVAVLRDGLAVHPSNPDLIYRLAPKLALLVRSREAYELAAAAINAYPGRTEIVWALATSALYHDGLSPAEVRAAHEAHAAVLRAGIGGALGVNIQRSSAKPLAPGRRLRLGFVSPDLRAHSVSYFLEPLLEGLGRERFHVTMYSNGAKSDDVTKRLKALASDWRQIEGMTDGEAAAKIRADGIEVLIDLAGYSVGHRLGVFALAPAPIQATYCGYAWTTGLPTMDYRIVDSTTDTPESDAWNTERLVRLEPPFLCYRPYADAPAVEARKPGAPIVFASFNATSKLNDRVIALWARVLNATKGSRLSLKGLQLADAPFRAELERRFSAAGVTPDRLTLLGQTDSIAGHLALYNGVDVALDPFPYHGTTTTCEALWMGVPVVTLAGRAHAQRVGITLLNAVGLPDLVARDEDEYVRIAAALAEDAPRRGALRRELRAMMRGSALMDAKGYAERFAAAIDRCRAERTATDGALS